MIPENGHLEHIDSRTSVENGVQGGVGRREVVEAIGGEKFVFQADEGGLFERR